MTGHKYITLYRFELTNYNNDSGSYLFKFGDHKSPEINLNESLEEMNEKLNKTHILRQYSITAELSGDARSDFLMCLCYGSREDFKLFLSNIGVPMLENISLNMHGHREAEEIKSFLSDDQKRDRDGLYSSLMKYHNN